MLPLLIKKVETSDNEYKVEFHTAGNTARLDKFLYANQLSYVRPGWIADFKSRSDGRPKRVFFKDEIGFKYFSYIFNYTFEKNDAIISEVVESSYFDSDDNFVGSTYCSGKKVPF